MELGKLSSVSQLISCYEKELKGVILFRFEYSPSIKLHWWNYLIKLNYMNYQMLCVISLRMQYTQLYYIINLPVSIRVFKIDFSSNFIIRRSKFPYLFRNGERVSNTFFSSVSFLCSKCCNNILRRTFEEIYV